MPAHAKKPKRVKSGLNTTPDKSNVGPKYTLAVTILFFIFIALFSSFKITGDDDIFWHLKTGEYIVGNLTVPSHDVFGYITEGKEWIPFEWGWDVVLYTIYNIGGYELITAVRTIFAVTIFVILFFTARKYNVDVLLIVILLFVFSFSIVARLNPRPQIISYLFLSILIWILLSYRNSIMNKKLLYLLPVMFLVWSNMHLGVLLGISVLALFLITTFVSQKKQKGTRVIDRKFIMIFFICVLSLLVNPNFIETYIYAYNHTQMVMLDHINEWKSPFDGNNPTFLNVRIFFVIAILGVFVVYRSFKRKDYFALAVFIVTLYLSLNSMRFIADFLILNFTFYAVSLSELNFNFIKNFFKRPIAYIGLIVLLVLVSYSITNNHIYEKLIGAKFREFGIGVNKDFYPFELIDFIKTEKIDETGKRPFNKLSSGGFLIWKLDETKNFIDSRNLSDRIYFEYKSIDLMEPGFERKLDHYEIDYVVYNVPYLRYSAHELRQTLLWHLMNNPEKWKLVFWDDKSFLFLRDNEKFEDVIERNEYSYISPFNLVFRPDFLKEAENPPHLKKARLEFHRKITSEPSGFYINEIRKHFPKLSY